MYKEQVSLASKSGVMNPILICRSLKIKNVAILVPLEKG